MDKVNNFHIVYLAAGYGSRISKLTNDPKCMLEINQETLLERSFRLWRELGIKNVTLVLGYKEEVIRGIVEKYKGDFNIRYQLNEDFQKHGNTFSLLLGIKDLTSPCLIFDADLIYDKEVLEDFINQGTNSQILIGPSSLEDIECSKTLIDKDGFARMAVDKRAVTTEELEKYQFVGEAIGILKFSIEDTLNLFQKSKEFLSHQQNLNLNWEHMLNQFLLESNIGIYKLTRGRSIEIDTPEDFQKAVEIFGK